MDLLEWWSKQQTEYPALSRMAKDFLSIQASSVASERSFSTSGLTIKQQRESLKHETVRRYMCLRSWMMQLRTEFDE